MQTAVEDGSSLSTARSRTAPLPRDTKAPDQVATAVPPRLPKRHHQRDIVSAGGRPPLTRPMSSPHATHAVLLQLQAYHDRLEKACGSTFQVPLQPPPKSLRHREEGEETADESPPPRKPPVYCRARILRSTRDPFLEQSQRGVGPPPTFSTPVGVKDCVRPSTGDRVYVSFHQTTPRCSEYLYGGNQESARRMRLLDSRASAAGTSASNVVVAKDHFALGPGQYELPTEKPRGRSAAAKFSPCDRFHDAYSTDQPGPGEYLTNETLVSPRVAAAVFSQRPRETDIASLVSPTANTVSSYYYVPESAFREAEPMSHRVGWSRTARFKSLGRHDRALLVKPSKPNATDFVAKNMLTVQRRPLGRGASFHMESTKEDTARLAVKRRSSMGSTLMSNRRATQATAASASRQQHILGAASGDHVELARQQNWTTVACLANVQTKLVRFRQLTATLQRFRSLQTHTHLRVTFAAWRTLDANCHRAFAAHLIVRNAWCLWLWTRIQKKRRHAARLRSFLHGLSFDVRFALSMKRIKRKIVRLQRWWRHVQLMVRAREEALYCQWLAVENRLRLEYINQLPYVQRIFTPPAGTAAAASAGGSALGGASANANASDLQLHRVLDLPEQSRWFTGRFVLSSDGSMRGYALDTDEVLVEIRQFRCHFHDISASMADITVTDARASYTTYTNATWKPILMLFRQGTFRFVVITSLSPLPTEILSWRDKLERLMVNVPNTSGAASSGSLSASFRDLPRATSVSDLVEVSMQSSDSPATHRRPSKVQARMRSIRQRTKSGIHVAEGSLQYYVVDLLKDVPKVPSPIVWATVRDKLREKRKAFRAELYRYKLEMFHYQEHQEHVRPLQVLAKFRDFFTVERPRRPHFRSLLADRNMESIIRAAAEKVKAKTPSNPRVLLDLIPPKQ